jgi:hypothetical protein
MGKFKVGDRVLAKNRGYEDGEHEAVVISDDNGSVLVEFNDGWTGGHDAQIHDNRENRWYSSYDELELLPVAEQPAAWQPKVGDRVRFTDKCDAFWWFGPHTGHKEGAVSGPSSYPGYQFEVKIDGEDHPAHVDMRHIEPLPVAAEAQPAALNIEAGKFYRTRDGRKAGPAEARDPDDYDTYPWRVPVDDDDGHYVYTDDGKYNVAFGSTRHDLIAEWVDEPAAKATVGAQVDTIAEEYGPVVAASNDNAPKASTAGFTIPLFEDDGQPRKLVKTKGGYGFELARFGNYAWVDTGQTAPITLKVSDIAA